MDYAPLIERRRERLQELETLIADPELFSDGRRAGELMREHRRIQELLRDWDRLSETERQLEENRELASGEDPELAEMAQLELDGLEAALPALMEKIQYSLLPRDATEDRDAIVEIRAGTGGDEAALFAGDLLGMYQRYADSRGWKFELLDASPCDVGGFREVTARVSGEEVFRFLKYESGDLGTELVELLYEVLSHVTRAGNDAYLAGEVIVAGSQHVLGEVYGAIAGGLRTDEGTAPVELLAGKNAGKLIAQALVLTKEVADFTTAHADIAGGYVCVRADVALELGHEALAECHYLALALTFGVKVSAAFTAAHGQGGEGVLEHLLETEELEDAQVHGGVEAQTALVRTDGAVVLHTITAVYLHFTFVIHPRHAEDDGALRFNDALKDTIVFVLLVGSDYGGDGGNHLLYSLKELGLCCVFGANLFQYTRSII